MSLPHRLCPRLTVKRCFKIGEAEIRMPNCRAILSAGHVFLCGASGSARGRLPVRVPTATEIGEAFPQSHTEPRFAVLCSAHSPTTLTLCQWSPEPVPGTGLAAAWLHGPRSSWQYLNGAVGVILVHGASTGLPTAHPVPLKGGIQGQQPLEAESAQSGSLPVSAGPCFTGIGLFSALTPVVGNTAKRASTLKGKP